MVPFSEKRSAEDPLKVGPVEIVAVDLQPMVRPLHYSFLINLPSELHTKEVASDRLLWTVSFKYWEILPSLRQRRR